MSLKVARRLGIALGTAVAVMALSAGAALGHEEREVGQYTFHLGLIQEPVYLGQKSGLEVFVGIGGEEGEPILGLETTLEAQVIQGQSTRELTLAPRDDAPGWYESFFIPTRAGAYTFQITGTVEDMAIDESFTSNPEGGFGEVEEVSSAQFPVLLPAVTEIADQAQRGADAAGLVPIALGVGALGLVVGLAGLGVALGARRRAP